MKKEIVFGHSVKGSLTVAQYIGIGDFPKAWIHDDGKDEITDGMQKYNEERIDKWYNSRPIGGRSADIICLRYDLSFGDISEKIPSDIRYQYIFKSTCAMYPSEHHDTLVNDLVDNLKKENLKYLNELKEAIKNKNEIRIWYSSAPDDINAFYWLMNFLDSNKYYKNISAVYIPPDNWNGTSYCRGMGMLGPEMYFNALKLEKIIPENQIKACSDRWEELRKENAPMRLMISGNLVSLPDSFLDSFISNSVNTLTNTFTIAQLIGEVMGDYGLMVGDRPLFERVLSFIERDELEIVEECKEKPMFTKVRKKSHNSSYEGVKS